MSFFCRLSRKHYWCTPHRSTEHKQLVQVCYECGAERPAREFHNDFATERLNKSVVAAQSDLKRLSTQRIDEEPSQRIAVGQRVRKFSLVK